MFSGLLLAVYIWMRVYVMRVCCLMPYHFYYRFWACAFSTFGYRIDTKREDWFFFFFTSCYFVISLLFGFWILDYSDDICAESFNKYYIPSVFLFQFLKSHAVFLLTKNEQTESNIYEYSYYNIM